MHLQRVVFAAPAKRINSLNHTIDSDRLSPPQVECNTTGSRYNVFVQLLTFVWISKRHKRFGVG